jgi:hypothetical protein
MTMFIMIILAELFIQTNETVDKVSDTNLSFELLWTELEGYPHPNIIYFRFRKAGKKGLRDILCDGFWA